MRVLALAFLLLLVIFTPGCKRTGAAANEPLTMETWQTYPPEKKYDIGTIERLKSDVPKFSDEREWNRFMKTVLIPGRKKELANGSKI
jgi:hypothetical protein